MGYFFGRFECFFNVVYSFVKMIYCECNVCCFYGVVYLRKIGFREEFLKFFKCFFVGVFCIFV